MNWVLIILIWTIIGFFIMVGAASLETNFAPKTFTGKFYQLILVLFLIVLSGPVWWIIVIFACAAEHICKQMRK